MSPNPNADVLFNYTVTPDDARPIFHPTATAAKAWLACHARAHAVHVQAHHYRDATRRAALKP